MRRFSPLTRGAALPLLGLLLVALPAAADARMPSVGQAFATAGDVGAQHSVRLGADNLLITGCTPSLADTRRCIVNPFDDDWEQGGLDCYYDVFVRWSGRRLRQQTVPGQCNGSRAARQDRAAPSRVAAFSIAVRTGSRHVRRMNAVGIMVEGCEISRSRQRTCALHVGGSEAVCHWEVTVVQRGRRVSSRASSEGCDYAEEKRLLKAAP
jgi:hypothetical protein